MQVYRAQPHQNFMQVYRARLHESLQSTTASKLHASLQGKTACKFTEHNRIKTSRKFTGQDCMQVYRAKLHARLQSKTSCKFTGAQLHQNCMHVYKVSSSKEDSLLNGYFSLDDSCFLTHCQPCTSVPRFQMKRFGCPNVY